MMIINWCDKNILALGKAGKFKEIQKILELPKKSAGKIRESFQEFSRQERITKRSDPTVQAERRARERLLEHARYCRRKASGATTCDPTGPTRMTRFGGKSSEDIRAERDQARAERKQAREEWRSGQAERRKRYNKTIRHTPEYRKMNAAYMRWYNHRTQKTWEDFLSAKKEYQRWDKSTAV